MVCKGYGKKPVTVYHCGEHTCSIIRAPGKNVQHIEQLVRDNPNIKPSEIQSVSVVSAFRQQLNCDEVSIICIQNE